MLSLPVWSICQVRFAFKSFPEFLSPPWAQVWALQAGLTFGLVLWCLRKAAGDPTSVEIKFFFRLLTWGSACFFVYLILQLSLLNWFEAATLVDESHTSPHYQHIALINDSIGKALTGVLFIILLAGFALARNQYTIAKRSNYPVAET